MKKNILLSLLLIIPLKIFSWTLNPDSLYENLLLKADKEYFFTQQENGFTLIIPKADSSKIRTELPEFPAGVKLVSSLREEYIDKDDNHGTTIHFWFTFTDTGRVELPALTVKIDNHKYRVEFEDVDVYENPSLINPRLCIEFEGQAGENFISKSPEGEEMLNIPAGSWVDISVYVQFATQIYNFDYQLPKNSIFNEVQRWESIDEKEVAEGFSLKKFPVGKFRWKPLVEGNYGLPQVSVNAIAYNGARKTISLPEMKVTVLPPLIDESSAIDTSGDSGDGVFEQAFTRPEDSSLSSRFDFSSASYCKSLAQARSQERHSFPWNSMVILNRQFTETEVGISSPQNEPSIPLLKLLILVFALFFITMIVLLFFRHLRTSLFFGFMAALCFVGALSISVQLLPEYGIFAGNNISSIPENKSASVHAVVPGQRVRLMEKAGDWIYIECSDYSGWVLKDTVYKIR